MKTFIKLIFLILILTMSGCENSSFLTKEISELGLQAYEEGYYKGQRDYATGDIRIKQVGDSCWVWSKSPWDTIPVIGEYYSRDNIEPKYHPPICDPQ